jgi:hypothetical protein
MQHRDEAFARTKLLTGLMIWTAFGLAVAPLCVTAQGWAFTPTGSLGSGRAYHAATRLSSGLVLVSGGQTGGPYETTTLSSAELYDPSTGTFTSTGALGAARMFHTSTLLPNGKVLVAGGTPGGGGFSHFTAELYDPQTGTFSPTGSLSQRRQQHAATLLWNGKVLIAGGGSCGTSCYPTTSAELYDPVTGTFAPAASMVAARNGITATELADGRILFTGGYTTTAGKLAAAEIYDPSTGTFTATANMSVARFRHTATLLLNGKVLVAGGMDSVGNTAELYDPVAGTFTRTGSLSVQRYNHTATRLPTGDVLVVGGYTPYGLGTGAELYHPETGTFSPVDGIPVGRQSATATPLLDGSVLVTGGTDPAVGRFTETAYGYGNIVCQ